MKKIISFIRINRERILASLALLFIMILIISMTALFSGCDNKKTEGLENIPVGVFPIECQIYYYTVDAVKNNDGSGLGKNKQAEKNFTVAAFWTTPCLNAIKNLRANEKQKLKDIINNLKTENKELKMKLKFLKEKIESQ